jgi:transposase
MMTTSHYIGIDVAKFTHVAAAVGADGGRIGAPRPFANDADGFAALDGWLAALGATQASSLVAMEATGHYWMALWAHLDAAGWSVAVVNPIRTDAYRKVASVRLTKTDEVDAPMIAEFARATGLSASGVSPEDSEGLRRLTRYRFHLVRDRTAYSNSALALLDRVFPEYAALFSQPLGPSSRALLSRCATPSEFLAADPEELSEALRRASRGRLGRDRVDRVREAAARSVGVPFALDCLSFELRHAVALIAELDREVGELDAKISEVASRGPAALLRTVPGVGPTLAAVVAAEVGDPSRFASPSKLFAYAGLDATVSQSGTRAGTAGAHVSKRGSSYLRWALVQAADHARRRDPYFGDYYEAKRAQGKHHYVALIAVARKLCAVFLALMREGRPYEPAPPARR